MATITTTPAAGPLVSGQYLEVTVSVDTIDPTEYIYVKLDGFWFFDYPDWVDAHPNDPNGKEFNSGSPEYQLVDPNSTWKLKLVAEGRGDSTPSFTITDKSGATPLTVTYSISDNVYIPTVTFGPPDDHGTVVLKPGTDLPADTDTNHVEVTFAGYSVNNGTPIGLPVVAKVFLDHGEDLGKFRIYNKSTDTAPDVVTTPADNTAAHYVVLKSDATGAFSFLIYPTADSAVGDFVVHLDQSDLDLGTVLVPSLQYPDPAIPAPSVSGISGGIYTFDRNERPVPIAARQGHGQGKLVAEDRLYLFTNPSYPPTPGAWRYTGIVWQVVPASLNAGTPVMYMPAAYVIIRTPDDTTSANTLAFMVYRKGDTELRTSSITRFIAENPSLGNHPLPPTAPYLEAPSIQEYRGGGIINADDVKQGLHVEIKLDSPTFTQVGVTPKATDTIEIRLYLNGYAAGTDEPKTGIPPVTHTVTADEITAKKVVVEFDRSDIGGYGASLTYGDVGTLEATYIYTPAGGSPVPSAIFGPVNFASRTMGSPFKKRS